MPGALKTVFLFALIWGAALSATAQKIITGTIRDARTEETLPAANISVAGTYRGTISNANGRYSLTIPDSLLPAEVRVRFIGYQKQSRRITSRTSAEQNFVLEPSVTEMQEITVTNEDPGMRIMREVIRRKQQWRKKLQTYTARAYTRQALSSDTSIVSITESASQIYWDEQQGHREVLKSRRQTANIEASGNFAGVSYLPNLYDDNIDIAGFDMVGITHPDALDYYRFKLIGQTSLDGQTLYKIRVIPDRNLQPLFKGTAHVLDGAYALLEVDLQPNETVTFPPPVKSFGMSYRQQFNNYGQEFWLPADMRIRGVVKIAMIGLSFPRINFKQTSRITDYRVNVALPDSLYKQEDTFTIDSTSVDSDSLIARQVSTVPLSKAEEQAYATLDSTATLEKAFKPSGFLARFVDDDEEEDAESDTSDSGHRFNPLQNIPGSIRPDARFNRVDELFAGLKYRISPIPRLRLRADGGYSTGYDEWSYGGGLSYRWLSTGGIRSSLGVDYSAQTSTRYSSHIYKPYFTIIPNLLGDKGYFDYYRSEGFRLFSKWRIPGEELSLKVGFNSNDHRSLPTTTAYDLLGRKNNYRYNPAINEGRMNTIDLVTGYNLNEAYNFGVTGQKYIHFEVEHSSGALGSDFDFTRYETRLAWSFPTFYKRRFLPNTLNVGLKAGTFSGELPYQKMGIVDGAIGPLGPYGILRALRGRPYEGEQYLALHAEHDFRTIPFEIIGLQPLVERDIGFILFAGAARTWGPSALPPQTADSYKVHNTQATHLEVGASLNKILGLFRIDFATRIDRPAFLINIGVGRLF
ncbi:MAG TPA: DUF5686 family protein [Fodinibius sp.]|nr:DUF5686 family protein [Fodinibius sp.]